jgi:dihydrofolate reductase
MPVIMGRKTFESVNKPLPGRINIIVTKQADWNYEGVIVTTDFNAALKKADETNCKEIFIAGGGEIYKQSMEIADRIYLTRVHTVINDADTFFSAIDENIWMQISNEDFELDVKHSFPYSFQIWERKIQNKSTT